MMDFDLFSDGDFDFADLDIGEFQEFACPIVSDESSDSASVGEQSMQTAECGTKRKKVARASKAKIGSKLARNASGVPAVAHKSPADALFGKSYQPNMTRRPKVNVLYVFPSFDKCDSLLYFPTTMTRHLNSGDFTSLGKLVNSHIDKSCEIDMMHWKHTRLSPKNFVQLFVLMNDMQPDRIMCVHNTKVVENHIQATMYMKFTDCQYIYNSVMKSIKDPLIADMMCGKQRSEHLKSKLETVVCSEEERVHYTELLQSEADLVVYVKIEMDLTFDDVTKKVIGLKFKGQLTSLHAVEDNFSTPNAGGEV